MKLLINKNVQEVNKTHIVDIQGGKAKTITGRWYPIVCDQCETDYEQPTGEYIVCNLCNKVTYVEDLK